MDIVTIVTFISLGTLGGITHVIIEAKSWEDLKKFSSFKRTVIGSIIGFLYMFLHTDYGFPDFVMSFVSAYAGEDFIKKLIDKLTKK